MGRLGSVRAPGPCPAARSGSDRRLGWCWRIITHARWTLARAESSPPQQSSAVNKPALRSTYGEPDNDPAAVCARRPAAQSALIRLTKTTTDNQRFRSVRVHRPDEFWRPQSSLLSRRERAEEGPLRPVPSPPPRGSVTEKPKSNKIVSGRIANVAALRLTNAINELLSGPPSFRFVVWRPFAAARPPVTSQ